MFHEGKLIIFRHYAKNMSYSRRHFLKSSALLGSALLFSETFGFSLTPEDNLDQKITSNIFQSLTNQVLITKIELLKTQGEFFLVVTSKDSITGISQCNDRMQNLSSLMNGLIIPFFIGKDARELVELTQEVYRVNSHYKYSGMPFWNCVGSVEIALWDLLGKTAQKPVYQFLGNKIRTEIPAYLSSLTRETTAEKEAEDLAMKLAETGAKAVKIKVGGRMKNTPAYETRTGKLIPEIRKQLGDKITIYADANSSYTVKEGIETGKMLEDYGVAIFEEPCPWEDYEGNRLVNKALKKIKLAGGEQDTSYFRFEDLLKNKVYDIIQPDIYYNGGIVRGLKVAYLAEKHSKSIAPHSPKADPLEMPFLHLAAVCPALYGFQEYPARPQKQPDWYNPHVLLKNGNLIVPETPGLGVNYDESIWAKAEKMH
jgi:L-alanine-DL-glutamate epimerase-like enolase superfamily enzyme